MIALEALLSELVRHDGSDLHLKVGAPPHLRVQGRLLRLSTAPLSGADVAAVVAAIVPERRLLQLEELGAVDQALSITGVGRFRVTVHRQRGSYGLVARRVPVSLPSLDALGLPAAALRLADERSGIVLVAGPAGSGRSTTSAVLIDRINRSRAVSVVTIEDPIEVLHADREAIVSQQEVGFDVPSFAIGAQRALRLGADVLVIGSVPDGETAAAVLDAGSTGQLVIATIAAGSAHDAIARLIDRLTPTQQVLGRQLLGASLRGVVCQRLVERADGRGRVPAVEVLVGTPRVVEAIADVGNTRARIAQAIGEGEYHGMQSTDQALCELVRRGLVTPATAMANAADGENLRITLRAYGLVAA